MRVKGSFLFMGTEASKSRDEKKQETYYKIGLMQGIQSKIFYVDELLFKKLEIIPVGAPVDVDLTITERDQKTFYQINDLQVVTLADVNKTAGTKAS